MSRELKFRVWLKRFSKMSYEVGRVLVAGDGIWACLLDTPKRKGELHVIYPDDGDVIEQYTGLKDKNGKEIYEGDIVRYGRHIGGIIPPESHTETVSWWSGEEEYYPCCTTSGFALPFSEDGYEVIGNIHENPELLEEE